MVSTRNRVHAHHGVLQEARDRFQIEGDTVGNDARSAEPMFLLFPEHVGLTIDLFVGQTGIKRILITKAERAIASSLGCHGMAAVTGFRRPRRPIRHVIQPFTPIEGPLIVALPVTDSNRR